MVNQHTMQFKINENDTYITLGFASSVGSSDIDFYCHDDVIEGRTTCRLSTSAPNDQQERSIGMFTSQNQWIYSIYNWKTDDAWSLATIQSISFNVRAKYDSPTWDDAYMMLEVYSGATAAASSAPINITDNFADYDVFIPNVDVYSNSVLRLKFKGLYQQVSSASA